MFLGELRIWHGLESIGLYLVVREDERGDISGVESVSEPP